MAVGKMEQIRQQQPRHDVTFRYVLNKFNPARALHLEIRQRLHQQLGECLLPIYIQRSDEISEALAAGATVMDYAPRAPVVEDFLRLTDWIHTFV
jgi:cellulose biosynthesis protein BcsQ